MELRPFSGAPRWSGAYCARTTVPGYRNGSRQEVVGRTGQRSTTFAGQIIYRLKCGTAPGNMAPMGATSTRGGVRIASRERRESLCRNGLRGCLRSRSLVLWRTWHRWEHNSVVAAARRPVCQRPCCYTGRASMVLRSFRLGCAAFKDSAVSKERYCANSLF